MTHYEEKEVSVSESEILKINKSECLLVCLMCNKKLVKVLSATDIPMETYIKCKCPYCGDFSQKAKIIGKYFIDSLNHSVLNIEDGIIYVN